MPAIIKLESGQYLNLDTFSFSRDNSDGTTSAILLGGGLIELSPKDLERIDQIANPPNAVDTYRDDYAGELRKLYYEGLANIAERRLRF